jgi:hypothetical protein
MTGERVQLRSPLPAELEELLDRIQTGPISEIQGQ